MPITPTYPGVYIQEIPSDVRTITGVPTSITAFIGRALRGPVNVPISIKSFADFERTFGGLWLGSRLGYAVRSFYLNGGSDAIVVRLQNGGSVAAIHLHTGGTAHRNLLSLEAANVGSWGNRLSAAVDHDTRPRSKSLFNLTVSEEGRVVEKFVDVSILKSSSRYLPHVLERDSGLVRVKKDSSGNWIVPNSCPTSDAVGAVPDSGKDGSALTLRQFIGEGMRDAKTGLYALEKADLFNLLNIPPYRDDENVDAELIGAAAQYCEERRAMLLVDVPSGWTVADLIGVGWSAKIGTTSKNAALYFPRIRCPDPLKEGRLGDFGPGGSVAGVIARFDAQRGVWKAPAGLDATIADALGLAVSRTDPENGELNPLGVNCLRKMPSVGLVVWGSRTLQGDDRLASEWKYIPVRRMALYIEESLYRGTQWVVFEPNDETLWSQIRLNVGAFMHGLFTQGAFQGTTQKDAYFVKCDSETTTQNDINAGIVNMIVGFTPLKPAEFVIIKIQQLAGQVAT